jgi:hydroxymethylpyrimidine/phosphomethylpyrimidine kinase
VGAVKTGLVPTATLVAAVAAHLRAAAPRPLVVDPVLVATSGDTLTDGSAARAIAEHLVPLASLLTPNRAEAAALAGVAVTTVVDMHEAARRLVARGARAVLVTGGDLADTAVDVLHVGLTTREFRAPRIPIGRVHGTGCALSAAITARLARGASVEDAVGAAKAYVTQAIAQATALGRGSHVLTHHPAPALGDVHG